MLILKIFDKSKVTNYPLEAPQEIVLDMDALSWPEDAIKKVFEFWYDTAAEQTS